MSLQLIVPLVKHFISTYTRERETAASDTLKGKIQFKILHGKM